MKTYHSYQGECRQAEAKLRLAESQRGKLEQSLSQDKLDRSKKYRMIEKEVMKVVCLHEFYKHGCNIYFFSAKINILMRN